MATKSPLRIVLGAGNVGDSTVDPMAKYDTPEQVNAYLDAFHKRGHNEIDTARVYSAHAPESSEPRLGAVEAAKRFIIDTKVASMTPGSHKAANVAKDIADSLAALKVSSFNIEYLHAPDRSVPFEETCEAIDRGFRAGSFKKFGLSNYTAEEVSQIVEICERRGFVRPSVYQGQFNPVVRGAEKELFPLLRKHKMAFYAWSPAGGGFFAGNHKKNQAGGRFDPQHMIGSIYTKNYKQPAIEAATDRALEVAAKHGIKGHAAALRWTLHHSILSAQADDAIILGASSVAQLETNLDAVEQGPLPEDLVKALDAIYGALGDSEIAYHF